jgi:hypothetical protein
MNMVVPGMSPHVQWQLNKDTWKCYSMPMNMVVPRMGEHVKMLKIVLKYGYQHGCPWHEHSMFRVVAKPMELQYGHVNRIWVSAVVVACSNECLLASSLATIERISLFLERPSLLVRVKMTTQATLSSGPLLIYEIKRNPQRDVYGISR